MFKGFFHAIVCSLIFFGTSSSASVINYSDWHLNTDAFQGLKQIGNTGFYLSVSKSNNFNINATYEILDGYSRASSADYKLIADPGYDYQSTHPYYNTGGWNGYIFEGIPRYLFLFNDDVVGADIIHAGGGYGALWIDSYSTIWNNASNRTNYWAGFVLKKDAASVPEPSMIALMGLGLLGLGLTRRKLTK